MAIYFTEEANDRGLRRQAGEPTLSDDLRLIVTIFRSRLHIILPSLAVAGVLGLAYLWFATPSYRSDVEILLDPRPRQIVDGEAAPTGLGTSSQGADTALVESQVGIVTSRSALTALIERFDLLDDPQFGNARGGSSAVVAAIKRMVYGPNAASQSSLSPEDRALEKLMKAIGVWRAGNTYIIGISAETPSALRSAELANGLAEIYLQQVQDTASDVNAESAAFLEARLAELKAEADAARHAVEDYRAAHGLISADRLLIGEQQLRDLSSQITQASIDSQTALANLQEVRRLAAAPAGGPDGASGLSSATVDALRAQLAAARTEELSLSASFGPKHPSMARLAERRASIETLLKAEYVHMTEQAESQYRAAAGKEQSLRALLAEQEARQVTANADSVALEELERVAQARGTVYQSFLTRSMEVREQVKSPASTARIISPAVPASRPDNPRMMPVMAVAVAAGLFFGLGLAWLHHLMVGTAQPRPVPMSPMPMSPVPGSPQNMPLHPAGNGAGGPAPRPQRSMLGPLR